MTLSSPGMVVLRFVNKGDEGQLRASREYLVPRGAAIECGDHIRFVADADRVVWWEGMRWSVDGHPRPYPQLFPVGDDELADVVPDLDRPGAWWGTYVVMGRNRETALGCGECDWEHRLPTPFLMGDAARLAMQHWHNQHGADAHGRLTR